MQNPLEFNWQTLSERTSGNPAAGMGRIATSNLSHEMSILLIAEG